MPLGVSLAIAMLGLTLAAWGSALTHERRLALAVWDQWDGRFPEHLRTPASTAGSGLLALGAAVVSMALLASA